MKIFNAFKDCHSNVPVALSIGNFDGVHLGHKALLQRLRLVAQQCAVITFSNHPSEVLHQSVIPHLTTLSHRLALFERMGIDYAFVIPFTAEFAKKTAETFLTELKQTLPFNYLILGHDAVLGHDRKKDLYPLSQKLFFNLEYIAPVNKQGTIISSSEIRKCIRNGNLKAAAELLGRPYSIFATVQRGGGKGEALGFQTANLPVEELALPPFGVWSVDVKINQEILPAVANLGYAPTVHQNRPPCLEVHLIGEKRDLYGKDLEVFFLKHLRPEKRFESIAALKAQIAADILCAKSL